MRASLPEGVSTECSWARSALDTNPQISLLVKLKLTKCAPILGQPAVGFFVAAQVGAKIAPNVFHARRPTLRARSSGVCARLGELCAVTHRAAPPQNSPGLPPHTTQEGLKRLDSASNSLPLTATTPRRLLKRPLRSRSRRADADRSRIIRPARLPPMVPNRSGSAWGESGSRRPGFPATPARCLHAERNARPIISLPVSRPMPARQCPTIWPRILCFEARHRRSCRVPWSRRPAHSISPRRSSGIMPRPPANSCPARC